jgi:hypothetical protein
VRWRPVAQFERLDPGLDPHRHDLGQRHANHRAGAVVHQLGDRAGADRADIARLVAHRVEHAFVAVELLLVAADPDRHLAAGGAARPAAHRRIEHVEVLFGEGGVDLAHDGHRIGRHVEERGIGPHPLDQPVGAERHPLDIGRNGERGEHHFAGLGDLARRIGPDRPFRQKRLGRGAVEVVDGELVAGLLQIGRHALAHHAKPDKTYAHLGSSALLPGPASGPSAKCGRDRGSSASAAAGSSRTRAGQKGGVWRGYSASWLPVLPVGPPP